MEHELENRTNTSKEKLNKEKYSDAAGRAVG